MIKSSRAEPAPGLQNGPSASLDRLSPDRQTHDRQPREHQPTDIRLGRIVRLLMEHATVVVSGTKLAQEISSSRSEVWRLIQQLRGLGVDVVGHPATGYQLRAVPDLLLPEILNPLIHGTILTLTFIISTKSVLPIQRR